MTDFSITDDDFKMIMKSLAHLIDSQCDCLTIGEACDAFDLLVKIEGLVDPTKALEHLSWDVVGEDYEL